MSTTVPTPSVYGSGYHRLIAVRMRAEIAYCGRTLLELEEQTEIGVGEFEDYFKAVNSWTLDDVELVCKALGLDFFDILAVSPAPSEMTIGALVLWIGKHYGRVVKVSQIINGVIDNRDERPVEQWAHLVQVCDYLAMERARGAK
ncbi:hypothetical protein [Nocardia sp. CA-120079]|uniref:hypothetical protein n=1 Tax=Nocardia sp. CA-120079 TaxID=3239974 RepID=UPI003D973650